MNLLVIGGSGLVGSNILDVARSRGTDAVGTYRSEPADEADVHLDKTVREDVISVVESIDPDVVVDTAAFHDVDDCEENRERAWKANAEGTYNVAQAANAVNAQLVYVSTDYVFPGSPESAPFASSDPVSPLNYYAETKYAGERAARSAESSTIVRSSVIFGTAKPNFVTWAGGELAAGNEVRIVDDQVSTPSYAPDVARACFEVAERDLTGTYHAAGPTSLSRYEFTVTLAEVFGYEPELITPITTEELGQKAPRPADSSLDSSTLYDRIDYEFRTPKEAFETMRESGISF